MMLMGTNAFAQMSVGAGYANSKSNYAKDKDAANGFYVGFDYNVPIGNVFGLSAGVNYEWLTAKAYKLGPFSGALREQYLNAPVRLNAGVNLGDAVRLKIYGGPVFSYGLSSYVDNSVSIGGFNGDKPSSDLYKDNGWNRFDVLVGGGLALELSQRIRLSAGYDWGMFNRLPEDSNDKITRNQLTAGLAFIF